MKSGTVIKQPRGFTLLEVILAMLLLSLLVGMVFATARASLALGNGIIKDQNEEMLKQAFFELLENRFSSLPGNAVLNLEATESNSHYLSTITLQNVPLSFNWGGQSRIAKATQLSTVKKRSGYLDIVLKYYEDEIFTGTTSIPSSKDEPVPFAEITLVSDVAYFEWRALDGRSLEWQYDWTIQGRLPLQLELVMAIGAKGDEIRQVFWIPPKQNPEVLLRQMMQSQNPNGLGGQQQAPDSLNPPGGPIQVPNPGAPQP